MHAINIINACGSWNNNYLKLTLLIILTIPSIIWSTPDGSSELQAGKTLVTQVDRQNCLVSLTISA